MVLVRQPKIFAGTYCSTARNPLLVAKPNPAGPQVFASSLPSYLGLAADRKSKKIREADHLSLPRRRRKEATVSLLPACLHRAINLTLFPPPSVLPFPTVRPQNQPRHSQQPPVLLSSSLNQVWPFVAVAAAATQVCGRSYNVTAARP